MILLFISTSAWTFALLSPNYSPTSVANFVTFTKPTPVEHVFRKLFQLSIDRSTHRKKAKARVLVSFDCKYFSKCSQAFRRNFTPTCPQAFKLISVCDSAARVVSRPRHSRTRALTQKHRECESRANRYA